MHAKSVNLFLVIWFKSTLAMSLFTFLQSSVPLSHWQKKWEGKEEKSQGAQQNKRMATKISGQNSLSWSLARIILCTKNNIIILFRKYLWVIMSYFLQVALASQAYLSKAGVWLTSTISPCYFPTSKGPQGNSRGICFKDGTSLIS